MQAVSHTILVILPSRVLGVFYPTGKHPWYINGYTPTRKEKRKIRRAQDSATRSPLTSNGRNGPASRLFLFRDLLQLIHAVLQGLQRAVPNKGAENGDGGGEDANEPRSENGHQELSRKGEREQTEIEVEIEIEIQIDIKNGDSDRDRDRD